MKKPAWICCVLVSAGAGAACQHWWWPNSPVKAGGPSAATVARAEDRPRSSKPPLEPSGPLADIARRMRGAGLSELQALAEEVASWKDDVQREAALQLLYKGMAEADPKAALAWARKNPGGDKQAFVRMLRAWAEVAPDAAVEAAYEDSNSARSTESLAIVLAHLATVHPANFFEQAKQNPSAPGHDIYVRAMQTMARRDPAEARKIFDSLDAKIRARLTGPFAEGWARLDAGAALAWARQLPEPDRKGAIFGIVTEIGPNDPSAALREAAAYLEEDGDPVAAPDWVVKAIARGLARHEPEKALAWVLDHTSGKDAVKTLAREVLPAIAGKDGPDAGARIVRALASIDDETTTGALKDFLTTWQPQDPAAQVRGLWDLPRSDARGKVLTHVAELWAMRDSSGLLQTTREAKEDGLRYCLAGALGNHCNYQRDVEGFLDVLPFLNPKFKAGFAEVMAGHLTWNNPATAAAFAARLPADADERHAAFGSIGKTWGLQEPHAALAWTETLGGKEQIAAAGSALQSWSAEDPFAASQWLQAHPQGPVHDVGAAMLAANLARSEPDSAFAWLQSMESSGTEDAHEKIYGLIFQNWVRIDPAAARQSVEEARVSEDQKNQLRAQFAVFMDQSK